jgi:adenine phosphoribosyltransferase
MNLASFLRDVPDFPKPGILFKDITPMLASPRAMKHAVDSLALVAWAGVDRIAAIESRGFLFGMPLALTLGLPFTPIRKPGKLPWKTRSVEYALEYGKDQLQVHVDGVRDGERVLLVDDLLATGGTMAAACHLVENLGGTVAGCAFIVELGFLAGRAKLGDRRIEALVRVG